MIRHAQNQDINRIVELTVQLLNVHREIDPDYYRFEDDYTVKLQSWAEQQLNSDSQFILVYQSPEQEKLRISGYISGYIKYLFPWFKIKSVGHISFLVVEEGRQKQGVGRELEQEAINWFKARGLAYIEVYTNEKNPAGTSAWTSYGYTPFNKFLRKKLSP